MSMMRLIYEGTLPGKLECVGGQGTKIYCLTSPLMMALLCSLNTIFSGEWFLGLIGVWSVFLLFLYESDLNSLSLSLFSNVSVFFFFLVNFYFMFLSFLYYTCLVSLNMFKYSFVKCSRPFILRYWRSQWCSLFEDIFIDLNIYELDWKLCQWFFICII